MAGDERIHLKVSSNHKERWQAYADDEYKSLSNLIRQSVEHEINSDGERGADSVGVPDELQRDIDTMNSTLAKLTDELQGVKRELRQVKSSVEEPDESVQEVADEVLDVLPGTAEPPTGGEVEAIADPDHPAEAGDPPTTVSQLADELDVPTDMVREAIDVLETETYMIHSSEHDGTTHYTRDE